MRFTEHELTVALAGAAKYLLALQDKEVRRGRRSVDEVWESMDRYARFTVLDGLSDQVLPALIALPDAEFEPGAPLTWTDAEIRTAVEERLGDVIGMLKRSATIRIRTELVRAALDALPPRQDPDALIVPDHL